MKLGLLGKRRRLSMLSPFNTTPRQSFHSSCLSLIVTNGHLRIRPALGEGSVLGIDKYCLWAECDHTPHTAGALSNLGDTRFSDRSIVLLV